MSKHNIINKSSRGSQYAAAAAICKSAPHSRQITTPVPHHSVFYRPDALLATQPHTHTHTRLTALCPGLPGWAGTRKVKPIWILLKQETVSGSGISWAIRKFAPRSRLITTPPPHHSVFYRPDALPAAQPRALIYRVPNTKVCGTQFLQKVTNISCAQTNTAFYHKWKRNVW